MTIPPRAPLLINFFNTILSWPVIILWFRQGYHTFLYGTRNTTHGVGEKEQRTNEQYGLVLTQVQEGQVYDTAFPVHLQTNADVHPSRNFHKATRNADTSWLVFPHCSWTLSYADWSLLLSGVDCPSASPFSNCLLWVPSSNSSLWHSLAYFQLRQDLELRPLFGFASKQTKRSFALRTPFIVSHVWHDLRLNPGLPDDWQILYPQEQWAGHWIYNK